MSPDRQRAIEARFAATYFDTSFKVQQENPDGSVRMGVLSKEDRVRMGAILQDAPQLFSAQQIEPFYRESLRAPLVASPYWYCDGERSIAWDQAAMRILSPQLDELSEEEKRTDPVWKYIRRGIANVRYALNDANFDGKLKPINADAFSDKEVIVINKAPDIEVVNVVRECPVPDVAQSLFSTAFEVVAKVREEEIEGNGGRRNYSCPHTQPDIYESLRVLHGSTGDLLSVPIQSHFI